MRLEAGSVGWVTGPPVADPPAVAVLEVSGAVFEWTIDDPRLAAATRLTITDVTAADWLWRVVGVEGHAAIVAARGAALDVEPREGAMEEALAPLRRLAVGWWLRRWWPESSRDGIVGLDPALLDGELALLTNAAQEYFTSDTVDSDAEGLLAPHRVALLALEQGGDPRVVGMVRACRELAEDAGTWARDDVSGAPDAPAGRRDDYALAAGRDGGPNPGAIARGIGSVDWVALPANVFDAAEDTVDWTVESSGGGVTATVRVATVTRGFGGDPLARGIGVRLDAGEVSGFGVLDARATARLSLTTRDGAELTENLAWDHDWSAAVVTIGPDRLTSPSAAVLRQRVRDVARMRLTRPGPDAFLAEILAAESDY